MSPRLLNFCVFVRAFHSILFQSRVVHQAKGERTFHIFYEVLRGCSDHQLRKFLQTMTFAREVFFRSCVLRPRAHNAEELGLVRRPQNYAFLNQSGYVPRMLLLTLFPDFFCGRAYEQG